MNGNHELFGRKLDELQQEYAQLQNQIACCSRADLPRLTEAIAALQEDCAAHRLSLQNSIDNGKNPAVKALSAVHLDYDRRLSEVTQQLFQQSVFDGTSQEQDGIEASMLFAEYAIDFATLSMKQAVLSALSARRRELKFEEETNG